MSKTIKYIGTQTRWPELATTGKQSTWSPGFTEERSDTEAAQLLHDVLVAALDMTDLLDLAGAVCHQGCNDHRCTGAQVWFMASASGRAPAGPSAGQHLRARADELAGAVHGVLQRLVGRGPAVAAGQAVVAEGLALGELSCLSLDHFLCPSGRGLASSSAARSPAAGCNGTS